MQTIKDVNQALADDSLIDFDKVMFIRVVYHDFKSLDRFGKLFLVVSKQKLQTGGENR